MRIRKLKIESHLASQKGLHEIDLTKKPLGEIVALVGKNGAGKSRILDFVKNYFSRVTPTELAEEYITNIPIAISGGLEVNLTSLKNLYQNIKTKNHQTQNPQAELSSWAAPIIYRLNQIGPSFVKIVDSDELKNIKATLANNATFSQILDNNLIETINNQPNAIQEIIQDLKRKTDLLLNEFSTFNSTATIDYLNNLTNEVSTDEYNLFLENRNNLEKIEEQIGDKKSYKLFNAIKNYVNQFLGKNFSYRTTANGNTISSNLYLNEKQFNIKDLSPGQKTLFAYAVLLFFLDASTKTNIKDSIIIIDEPEKHLHPEAQINLIDSLRKIVSKSGQLWIATHSINILSHLNYDEIIMVKDDSIILPSRTTPGNSFNELMGIENHIHELGTFITSISEWSFGNFILQCFKEPDVVLNNDPKDPQFKLLKDFILESKQSSLLDFGAGKGRIGYTLQDDDDVSKRIGYFAYEPNKIHFESLSKIPNINGFYSDLSEIKSESFDSILLCNVLHEISPVEWKNNLEEIKRALNPKGYLIIIEDRFLPKGEMAHEFGYLILGIEQLKVLFNDNSVIELKASDTAYNDRIIFCAIQKKDIEVTKNSILSSLESLRENSFIAIKNLKKSKQDLNQGRQYANQTQLYINAQLAIEFLKKEKYFGFLDFA